MLKLCAFSSFHFNLYSPSSQVQSSQFERQYVVLEMPFTSITENGCIAEG